MYKELDVRERDIRPAFLILELLTKVSENQQFYFVLSSGWLALYVGQSEVPASTTTVFFLNRPFFVFGVGFFCRG